MMLNESSGLPFGLFFGSINQVNFLSQRSLHPVRPQQRGLYPREVVPRGGRLLLEDELPHCQGLPQEGRFAGRAGMHWGLGIYR